MKASFISKAVIALVLCGFIWLVAITVNEVREHGFKAVAEEVSNSLT